MIVAHRRHGSRVLIGIAFGIMAAAFAGPVHAELLRPTPLILKDGRIASVSVHVLPFAAGAAAIDDAAAGALVDLTRQMATDCFLTAQVIGHVGTEEAGSGDTLAAHRLARSRADAVQATLIDGGLPAKSIASVWDWQFMILEPRATLWVFQLTQGEDCEGEPLAGAAALVASRSSGSAAPAAAPGPAEAPAGGIAAKAAATARQAAAPRAASDPAAAAAPVARALPAVAPSGRAAAAAPAGRTTREAPSAAAARTAPSQKVVRAAPAENPSGAATVSIVFATNSSYFPAGTPAQLEALVRDLEPGGRYRVELVASVSDASTVVGAESAEEAARYNQWLADRRLDRVRGWLEANVKDRTLIIEPKYEANDDSRRVLVRLAPSKTG
ncbi:MAG TPA: hypothetical protein VFZ01_13050 [Geminicoccaceae bacterium]